MIYHLLSCHDSHPLQTTIQNQRHINNSQNPMTIAQHVLSSVLVPCPVAPPRWPEDAQAAPSGSPRRSQAPPKSSRKLQNYKKHTNIQPHRKNMHEKRCNLITSSDSHSPKYHGHKSKVNGPRSEVMVRPAGPRRVCN